MKRRALLATLFAAVACCFIPSPAWCRSRRNSRGRGRGRWRTPNPLSSLPTARHTGRIVRLGDENPRIKDGIGSSSNTVATLHEQAKVDKTVASLRGKAFEARFGDHAATAFVFNSLDSLLKSPAALKPAAWRDLRAAAALL